MTCGRVFIAGSGKICTPNADDRASAYLKIAIAQARAGDNTGANATARQFVDGKMQAKALREIAKAKSYYHRQALYAKQPYVKSDWVNYWVRIAKNKLNEKWFVDLPGYIRSVSANHPETAVVYLGSAISELIKWRKIVKRNEIVGEKKRR